MIATVVSLRLLRAFLTVEVAVAFVALVAVAVHALSLWRRQRADAPRLARGYAAVAAEIGADRDLDEDRIADLRRLPRRVQRRIVEDLAVSLSGRDGDRLGGVAQSLGLVAAAQRRCRSRWWWRRLLGAHQLNVYDRGAGVLVELFDDSHPAVRAQVIQWAGDARREELAGRLVSSLQDPSALCRHSAADSILRAGAAMVDTLARELSSRSGQEQADLLAVLARRPDLRYLPASLVAVADDLPAVRAAAAAVLGGVGGPEAGAALESLLVDPDAAVRAAAADGLRRLGHEGAAPSLAPLLRDSSFAVRQTAGAALASLGPGGILLLRRYASDEDRFASDMARYSLEVAALGTSRAGATGNDDG